MSARVYEPVSMETAYERAHSAAVLVDRSNLGLLKFTGKTRLDLINRMSTQKVIDLQSGQGAATVLTTDIGRIIDRLILYTTSDAVYCLTGANNADNIAAYLKRFVFFMDDFHVEDLTEDTAVLAVYGRQAGLLLTPFFGKAVNIPLHHWRQIDLDGTTVYLHRADPVAGDGYYIMAQMANRDALWKSLVQAGITPVDRDFFEYLRIESGLPLLGNELTADYIPLETDLWDDVSFNKGCYTGQEIIARMESRGRLAKRLVRLKPAAPVSAGMELEANGKKVGTITSAADGPNDPVALAYIKTAVLEQSASLSAGSIKLSLLTPPEHIS